MTTSTALRVTGTATVLLLSAALARGQQPPPPGGRPVFAGSQFSAQIEREKAPYLGIATSSINSDTLSGQLGLPRGVGLAVDYVDDKGPSSGKLKQHDVLHKLNDQLLVNHMQLATLVRTFKPGDKVTLSVFRSGKPEQVQVELGEKELPKLNAQSFNMPQINLSPRDLGGFMPLMPGQMDSGQIDDILKRFGIEGDKFDDMKKAFEDTFPGGRHTPHAATGSSSVNIRSSQGSTSMSVRQDKDYTFTITTNDQNKKQLVITDKEGKPVFSGEVNSPEDIQKVPEELRPRVEQLLKIEQKRPVRPQGTSGQANGQVSKRATNLTPVL